MKATCRKPRASSVSLLVPSSAFPIRRISGTIATTSMAGTTPPTSPPSAQSSMGNWSAPTSRPDGEASGSSAPSPCVPSPGARCRPRFARQDDGAVRFLGNPARRPVHLRAERETHRPLSEARLFRALPDRDHVGASRGATRNGRLVVFQPIEAAARAAAHGGRSTPVDEARQQEALRSCRDVAETLYPGLDLTEEIGATHAQGLGDTVLVEGAGGIAALRGVSLRGAQ